LSAGIKLHRFDLNLGTVSEVDDIVASDRAVCVFVNDEFYKILIVTPTMIKELVVGHLLGEGVIRSLDDLKRVEVEPLRILVELCAEVNFDQVNMSKMDLITTTCGSASLSLTREKLGFLRIASDIRIEAWKICGMVTELNLRGKLYRETGGTHSAMLCTADGGVISFAEDVGRHNAVDKVIGAGLLSGVDLKKCVLVSSGRQSSEIVLKVARSGIPVIASVAGPLESGIGVAEATGITLICFIRGRRMNLYSHPERVTIGEGKSL
jgi:FdhD protein